MYYAAKLTWIIEMAGSVGISVVTSRAAADSHMIPGLQVEADK